tara:strand:- start:131 stop:910 length:780 start_codon:yes stop_codon:yes gene_type:complete
MALFHETRAHLKSTDLKMLKTIILLCRHAEGQHLTGEKFSMKYGPSLTKAGAGQAYRRCVRQLKELNIIPDVILISPQLRAIQTTAFARKNRRLLSDGKTILKDVPVEILPNAYEQTRLLAGQGNIIPLFHKDQHAEKWKNETLMRNDRPLWKAVENAFPLAQPKPDKNGSSQSRSRKILAHLEKNYKGKVVLLVCHDGIARDIISQYTGVKNENVFDLVEIRNLNSYQRGTSRKKTTQSRRKNTCRKVTRNRRRQDLR